MTEKEELQEAEQVSENTMSQQQANDLIERLRLDQNLPLAIVAGLFTGILGALLWGLITVSTGFQIGYMALAIGAGVGFSIRYLGKGIDQVFGIAGAVIAVLSCFLGNFFSIIGFYAKEEGVDFFETLMQFDYSYFFPVMSDTFGFMDLVFYAIAGYEGYKFAFRVLTEEDIAQFR